MSEEIQRSASGLVPGEMGYAPKIDAIEQAIADNLPPVETPLVHQFVPGQYIREIFLPRGSIHTTKIHMTKHPFFILKGKVLVYTVDQANPYIFEGPCWGLTEPGTRRAIVVLEDTVWVTVHAVTETDLAEIEKKIIKPHIIPQRKALP